MVINISTKDQLDTNLIHNNWHRGSFFECPSIIYFSIYVSTQITYIHIDIQVNYHCRRMMGMGISILVMYSENN